MDGFGGGGIIVVLRVGGGIFIAASSLVKMRSSLENLLSTAISEESDLGGDFE